MGDQIFHPSILLASIRWQSPIRPSRHLGSYSIRGVLGDCSGTFPSLQTSETPCHYGIYRFLLRI